MNPRDDISQIIMYSTAWCSDCVRAKMFLDKFKIQYTEIDIDHDSEAEKKVIEINGGRRTIPTILIEFTGDNQDILIEPTFDELAKTLLTP